MSGLRILRILAALSALLLASPVLALDELPWRLKDYPNGGQPLTDVVANTLVAQGDLIVPTCNELRPGTIVQIGSGLTGISVAIADSDPENASIIVDGMEHCWKLVDRTDADSRIALGTALALAARQLAETNLEYAREIEMLVAMSNDDIIRVSYEIARGQDDLGLLIAQEEGNGVDLPPIVPPQIGGGGIASYN